jgi:hypothetical protein
MSKEQGDAVCDATGDAICTERRAHAQHCADKKYKAVLSNESMKTAVVFKIRFSLLLRETNNNPPYFLPY